METEVIKSITSNHHYKTHLYEIFKNKLYNP